jgi:hypothetical protein
MFVGQIFDAGKNEKNYRYLVENEIQPIASA